MCERLGSGRLRVLCTGDAGIVNERGLGDSTAFDQIIGDTSSEVREMTSAVRRLVYEVLPETVELVPP